MCARCSYGDELCKAHLIIFVLLSCVLPAPVPDTKNTNDSFQFGRLSRRDALLLPPDGLRRDARILPDDDAARGIQMSRKLVFGPISSIQEIPGLQSDGDGPQLQQDPGSDPLDGYDEWLAMVNSAPEDARRYGPRYGRSRNGAGIHAEKRDAAVVQKTYRLRTNDHGGTVRLSLDLTRQSGDVLREIRGTATEYRKASAVSPTPAHDRKAEQEDLKDIKKLLRQFAETPGRDSSSNSDQHAALKAESRAEFGREDVQEIEDLLDEVVKRHGVVSGSSVPNGPDGTGRSRNSRNGRRPSAWFRRGHRSHRGQDGVQGSVIGLDSRGERSRDAPKYVPRDGVELAQVRTLLRRLLLQLQENSETKDSPGSSSSGFTSVSGIRSRRRSPEAYNVLADKKYKLNIDLHSRNSVGSKGPNGSRELNPTGDYWTRKDLEDIKSLLTRILVLQHQRTTFGHRSFGQGGGGGEQSEVHKFNASVRVVTESPPDNSCDHYEESTLTCWLVRPLGSGLVLSAEDDTVRSGRADFAVHWFRVTRRGGDGRVSSTPIEAGREPPRLRLENGGFRLRIGSLSREDVGGRNGYKVVVYRNSSDTGSSRPADRARHHVPVKEVIFRFLVPHR